MRKEGKPMAFGIGIPAKKPQQALPAGSISDVAVKCWFTATGRSMPLMMKLQSEEGVLEIPGIQVLTSEKQCYAGILNWKYRCRAEVNQRMVEFILLFNSEECTWKLVV